MAFNFKTGSVVAAVVASGTGDAAAVAAAADLRLMGYSIKESAGSPAAATLTLRHGTASSDPEVAFVNLAASGSETKMFGECGIACPNGIYVDRLTGSTTVVVYYKSAATN